MINVYLNRWLTIVVSETNISYSAETRIELNSSLHRCGSLLVRANFIRFKGPMGAEGESGEGDAL